MVQVSIFIQVFITILKQGGFPLSLLPSHSHPILSRVHNLRNVLLHRKMRLWHPAPVSHSLRQDPHPGSRLFLVPVEAKARAFLFHLQRRRDWGRHPDTVSGSYCLTENGEGWLREPGLAHVFTEAEKSGPEREKTEVDVQYKAGQTSWPLRDERGMPIPKSTPFLISAPGKTSKLPALRSLYLFNRSLFVFLQEA